METPRARQDRGDALIISDPEPLNSSDDVWSGAAQVAVIGIFIILAGVCLYLCRPILLPVSAAMVIGLTLAPIVKVAQRFGIPSWLAAVTLAVLMLVAVGVAAMLLAAPVSEWIGRAPEIGASVKQKLYVLDRPLAALQDLRDTLMPSSGPTIAVETPQFAMFAPVLTFVTPAVTETVIFLVTFIFFLAGQMEFRRYLASLFTSREAKLRFIRIANDIEHNLASYVAIVTVINFALGVCVAAGAWLFGLPNPLIFGVLAMVLNYIPYIGPAGMALILLAVGLGTFSSLGQALLPPAGFVGLTTFEGQLITPTVLGRRLTLEPLAVFLALAFWAWLWGPMGAFLAVPLLIIARS